MHLNNWKSVLVSWANALEVVPTTLNFIGDLSPHFFVNLCTYLNGNVGNTSEDAVTYITDYYKSLILGNEEDENYFVLLATAYLILTSVHNTNDELCKRLCRVSDREQAQIIKTALEAFVEIQPPKITKELLFRTLAQLPGDPESCGNSPYLTSSGSRSSNKGTPGTDGETPYRTCRRSSRFKRVKHQLQMTMSLKNCLQEELDSARETISNLESVVLVKNQDIAQLKERCQRLLNESEADRSGTPSGRRTPTCDGRECGRCKALERQVASYQEDGLHDKSRIEELTEALATLNKKIIKLESEQRSLDDQMRLYEEQILKNNNEISTLQQHQKDLIANKNELESIIEELKETRSAEDCSLEGDIPNNLGNEVIDLQLTELRFSLDDKVLTIQEQNQEICNLRVKLEQKDADLEKMVAIKDEKICVLEQEAACLTESLFQKENANANLSDECNILKSTLAEKGVEISDLQNEILQHRSVIQSMQQENELCNTKILTLNCDIEKLASSFDQVTRKLSEVKNQKAGIENLLEEYQLRLASVSEELDKQKEEFRNKEALCKDHEKLLIIKDEKLASMEGEIECINQVVAQEHEKNEKLLKELEKSQLNVLRLETAVKDYLEKIDNFESVKRELDQEILNCKERVDALEGIVLHLKNTNQQTVSELEEVVEQKKCVEMRLQEAEKKVLDLSYLVSDLRNQLKQESAKLIAVLKDNQEAMDEKDQTIYTFQKSLEEENTKLQEFKSRCVHLEETVALKEEDIGLLEQGTMRIKETLQQELDAKTNLEVKCTILQSSLVEKSNEISVLKDEVLKYQSVTKENLREIELSNAMVFSLQSDVEKLKGDYKLATTQLINAQKVKEEIEQQLHESFQRISTLSEEMVLCKEELQKLESLCRDQEKALTEKNENVTSLEEEAVRITAAAELAKAKNKELVAEMETQKVESEKLHSEMEKTVAVKDRIISSLEEELGGIKQVLQQELDAKTNLEVKCTILQSSLVEKSKEISVLKDEVLKYQSVTQENLREIELSNAMVLSLQNDIKKLTGDYQLATTQLVDTRKVKEEIEQQLHDSLQCISTLSEEIGLHKEELQKLELLCRVQEKALAEKNENVTSLEEEAVRITAAAELEKTKNKELITEMETQKLELEKRHIELEETVTIKERLISSQEEEIKGIREMLQKELDAKTSLEKECIALQSTVAEKCSEISILNDELLKNQSVIQEKLQEIELSNSRALSLQNDVEKLTGDYQLATTQLVDTRKVKEETEQQLHDSFQRISTLSEEMGLHKEELQKLESLCREQEKALTEKNANMTSLEEEAVRITAAAELAKAKNKELVADVETQRLEFEKRHIEIEETVTIKERLISSQEEEIKGIRETLQKELDAKTSLEKECIALQSTVAEKSNEISFLNDELLKNQSVIQEKLQEIELINSRAVSLQNDVKKLTDDYQLATTQLVDTRKVKEKTEQQLHDSFQRISTLSEEMGLHKKELQKLESLCREQEKALTEKNENITSLEEEAVRITAAAELAKAKNKELVAEMETQRLEFEKRHIEIEETVTIRERLVNSQEEEIKGIREALQKELDAKTSLENECITLQSTVAEKSNEISILKDELLKNQSHIQEKRQQIELSNSRALSLQNDVEKLTGDLQLATTQLADTQKVKEDIEQQLQVSFQRISTLSAEMGLRNEELQKLESLCREQEKALTEKNENMTSLEEEAVSLTAAAELEKTKNKELITEMETQRLELEKRHIELEETVTIKERLISSQEEEIKGIREMLQKELDAKTSLEKECIALQSTVAEKSNEISFLNDELLKNQSVIQEKLQEIELINSRAVSLQNDVKKLTGDLQLATTQLVDTQKVKEEIEQQLCDCLQRISTLSADMENRMEQLQKLELQCREQDEALGENREKLASLENVVAHAELVKREIEAENLKCNETIVALQSQVVQLTQSNEITDAKLLKILELKNVAEERVTALEGHLRGKISDEEKLQQDLLGLKTLVKEKELALESEEEKKHIESLKNELELNKARSESVVLSLQGEVERLTKENELATSCVARLKCENESLNRRIENCNMDLDIKNETILMMQTTLSSLNSKIAHLEAEIKVKDADLHNVGAALEKYREEHQSKLLSRIDEMMVIIQQKDAELAKLHKENDSKCERIEKMAEELVNVSQTFNIEKTSLIDHTNNLEEMLEKSTSTEKTLQTKITSLTKQLELKEGKLSRLDEKLSLTIELHNCEKRELLSKNDFLKTQMDEIKLKYDRLVKDMEECNVEHLRGKISRLETESQELRDKLELKVKDIQWYVHELGVMEKSANQTMKVNAKLEEEIQSLTRNKAREIAQLEKEVAVLLEKTKQVQPQASDISAKLRQEYEEKLDKLKAKMRKVYTEKVEAMMKYQTGEEKMFMDEELKKEKQKRLSLESKVRELSDQLLIVQEERRALISNNIFRTPAYPLGGPISNPAYESPPMYKAQSLDRLPVTSRGLDNLGADLLDQSCSHHLDQSFSSRRTSTSSNRSSQLPKGIGKIFLSTGKVFPAAEEDGEVFDNRCLADLKEGICTVGPGGVDRMSILQQRNSMCPPHLKSSYPVESQFFTPNAKEDEIKVISRGNKENLPEGHRTVPVTPSKLRSLFTGRRKH